MIPKNFDSGYVTGALLGDGTMCTARTKGHKTVNHYIIQLAVKSKEFARRFEGCLKRLTGKSSFYVWRDTARVRIYSKQWYSALLSLKKRVMRGDVPKDVEFKRGLIAGFYDSEGGLYRYKGKYFTVHITNTNRELLRIIRSLVQEFGVEPSEKMNRYLNPRECYKLRINKVRSIVRFFQLIGEKCPICLSDYRSLWTEDEKEKLRRVYRKAQNDALLELFPGRSLSAIRTKAWKIGLRRGA